MKSLLFVHHRLILGGAERILVNYLNLFAQNPDYQVTLVLHFLPTDSPYLSQISPKVKIISLLDDHQSREFADIDGFFDDKGKSYQTRFYALRALLCDKMAQLLSTEKVDCVINFNTHFDFFLERHQLSIPVIRWVHGLLHLALWQDSPQYYRPILSRHTAIITLNDEMQNLANPILARLNVSTPTYRLYNPIDLDDIVKKSHILPTCQHEQALLNQPFLLQVGRLDTNKNHQTLIDIFAKLKAKKLPHKLYIIGAGEQHKELSEQIKRLNLTQDCLLLGERTNPYPFMRQATLFLHTSLSEGLPTVLIESMACGTPVVAMHALTGVADILAYGKYGVGVKLGDDTAFANAVWTLINEPSIYQHYANNLDKAVERFALKTVAKETFALFSHLLNAQKVTQSTKSIDNS